MSTVSVGIFEREIVLSRRRLLINYAHVSSHKPHCSSGFLGSKTEFRRVSERGGSTRGLIKNTWWTWRRNSILDLLRITVVYVFYLHE